MITSRGRTLCGATLVLVTCSRAQPAGHDAATTNSVRAFMATIARGVTAGGPAAWRDFFLDDSTFFMASEGRLVFPTSDAATRGIDQLKQVISSIALTWGDTIRADPLAPGLTVIAAPYHEVRVDRQGHHVDERGYFTAVAEQRRGRWLLRDAHWSVETPPTTVP